MDSYHHFNNGGAHLPPGFRFHPTDEELITCYLLKKVLDSSFSGRAIAEVDINKCEPWELPEKATMGEKEWYFFSLRDRKYPTGLRTNRATEAGYWKATGKDREIYSSKTCALLGMKKTLVFYRGRAPKGEKSDWVMHEYRLQLQGKFAYRNFLSTSSKDEWVISRVFHKSGTGGAAKRNTTSAASILLYQEPSSPSSVSLPPLLDPTAATGGTTLTDRDNFSYEIDNQPEHVSCFSTNAATLPAYHGGFDLALPPVPPPQMINNTLDSIARYTRNVSVPVFPSLRSLEENSQLPFFLYQSTPATAPPFHDSSSVNPGAVYEEVNAGSVADGKMSPMSPTVLDCMWTH